MNISTHGVRRWLAVATVAALVPVGLQSPVEAAVATPTSLTPTGPVSSNTPTLSWSTVSGASKYEVQVDNDSDFGSPLFVSTTTNNRSVPDKILPAGEVSWRVRAVNATNVASSWAHASFLVAATGVPAPISPVNGEVLPQPTSPPLLVWAPTQGATKYTVQIDATDNFVTPLVSVDTQTTSLVAPNPLPAGEYFWQVKATKATGVDSVYSNPARFGVGSLPAVTVVGPNDNPDNEVEDVVLDWNPLAGAAYYQVQVATDTDFNTLVDPKNGTADEATKVMGTRYSPAVTYDNNQYFWRVRAVDVAGRPTAWSPIQAQFNRVWPEKPTAVYPVGSEAPLTHVTGPMYFQWSPIQHATQYELQLGSDDNFSPGTTVNCQTAGTTYTPGLFGINHVTGAASIRPHEVCNPVPGRLYYWRVRALDRPFQTPGVEGLYSDTQAFVYDEPTFDITGFSPTNGETVDIPTLSWDPVMGADHYKLSIQNGLGQSVKTGVKTYSTSYTPVGIAKLDPAKGPYHWFVSAFDAGSRPMSLVYENTFNLSGSIPTTGAAALTPLTGTSGDTPTVRAPELTWEPYPGADHYQVFVGPHGSGTLYTPVPQDALQKKLPYAAVTDTWTWFLKPGQYDWFVQAYSAGGAILDAGPTATLTVQVLDPVQGQELALGGLTLDAGNGCAHKIGGSPDICTDVPATPVFSWDPVDGAGSYIVYVSEDATFTNLVEPLTSVGATNGTRWTPTMSAWRAALADSQAGGAYYWFVRPCKVTTICGPNPVSTNGMATNKFRKKSPAIAPTLPAAGGTVASADVVFDWQDYRDTNAATTWATTGEKSNQSAMNYRVQVDNDATFASPIETVDVDQSTYTSKAKLYPEGELYWHVQAIDAEGNALSSSPTRTFKKATTPVSLQAPVGGLQVSGTPAFRWAAQAAVGSYQLEVYKNNDTAGSSANKLFSTTVTTKQSAYVFSKPIPASASPYVWRVRRVDSSSPANPGPWSAWGQFRSNGAAPSLLTPTAGSFQPRRGVLFSWSQVSGATTYTVESRSASSTARLPGTPKTTPANAWATTALIPDGIWEWRVVAKDVGGSVLGTSGWRQFKVDATAPRVVSKSPTVTAYRTANFKVRFSEPVKGVSSSTYRIYRAGTTTPMLARVTLSADRRTATLNPNSNLRVGRYYVIKVRPAITDMIGNRLVATSWKVRAR